MILQIFQLIVVMLGFVVICLSMKYFTTGFNKSKDIEGMSFFYSKEGGESMEQPVIDFEKNDNENKDELLKAYAEKLGIKKPQNGEEK